MATAELATTTEPNRFVLGRVDYQTYTLPPEDFARFLRMREGSGDSQVVGAFRAWIQDNLLTPGAAGDPSNDQ